jgi:hypothetical protein
MWASRLLSLPDCPSLFIVFFLKNLSFKSLFFASTSQIVCEQVTKQTNCLTSFSFLERLCSLPREYNVRVHSLPLRHPFFPVRKPAPMWHASRQLTRSYPIKDCQSAEEPTALNVCLLENVFEIRVDPTSIFTEKNPI